MTTYLEGSPEFHLWHLEDEFLTDNIGTIDKFIKLLQSKTFGTKDTISAKFDGSALIIFGKHPETGKFTVGTKRIVNRPAYSEADIKEIYSDNPSLMKDLLGLFGPLKASYTGDDLLGGDLFFTPGSKHIEDNYIVLKPNIIIYKIPVNSQLGAEIQSKDYGIVVHTKFTGTMREMRRESFHNIEVFKKNPDLIVLNALIKFKNKQSFEKDIAQLKQLRSKIAIAPVDNMLKPYKMHILSFFVKAFQNDKGLQAGTLMKELQEFLLSKYKTPKSQKLINDLFAQYSNSLFGFAYVLIKLVEIKNKLVDVIAADNEIKTFHQTPEGKVESNAGEGYVVYFPDKKMMKLVKRNEFTKFKDLLYKKK